MKLLDFQQIGCASPVNDLSFCLYSGASKLILDKLDDLLVLYINSFSETLTKLNCKPQKPYTLEKLRKEWKEYCKFGFVMGTSLWRKKLMDSNHVPSGDGSLIPLAAEHVNSFNERMKDLVLHFYENGYFGQYKVNNLASGNNRKQNNLCFQCLLL